MSEFNLVDEPWIPVVLMDGRRLELGIRDVYRTASQISRVEDGSPLVVAALHRFLLAVLYRALEGPTDLMQARSVFREGLPAERIDTYLDRWRDRFWLFDDAFPFGQNPAVDGGNEEPWTKLTAECNDTSRKVLFDHIDTRNPGSAPPAACARWLLTTMTFSVSGGRGYRMAPEPNGLFCMPIGTSLQATLCLNLVPYPNREVARGDIAQWECSPGEAFRSGGLRQPLGVADLYTWPARSILLHGSATEGVRTMSFAAGVGCERSSMSYDPMLAYRVDKERGLVPIRLRSGRDMWRDYSSLLPDPSGEGSLTVKHAQLLVGQGPGPALTSLLVVGQKNDPPNAGIDFWRMSRFTLPHALQGERLLRRELEHLLAEADDTEASLRRACVAFARDLLSRGARAPDKRDLGRVVGGLPVLPRFWADLQLAFQDVLSGYSAQLEPDLIRERWIEALLSAMSAAWDAHRTSCSVSDTWTVRALVRAEAHIRRAVGVLRRQIEHRVLPTEAA